jgi:hypothetical protein
MDSYSDFTGLTRMLEIQKLHDDIAAFEAWQQTPDGEDDFRAIHVALMLSKQSEDERRGKA